MPKYGAAIDTQRIPILGLRAQQSVAASPPSAPVEGLFWHDTTNNVIKVYLGSSWKTLGEAGAGGPPSGAVPAGGDLSGSYPAPTIGDAKVTLAKLSATGTKDATTYLRGDNTWAVVSSTPSNVTDGDKGDIIVASGVWSIDTGVVTSAKIADNTILAGDLGPALKPSGTAINVTEALRALGYTTGQAMPGATTLDNVPLATGDVSLQTYKILNLGTPGTGTDAANKAYVDSVAQGLDAKPSVRARVTSVPGSWSGTQWQVVPSTLDGLTPQAGDRFLVDLGTASSGIFVWAAGDLLNRAADMDTWAEVPGAFVFVEQGTSDNNGYVCTSNPGLTINVSAITFTQFSSAGSIVAGAGLVGTSTFDVNPDGATIEVVSDQVRVKAAGIGLAHLATGLTDGTAGSKQVRALGIGATDATAGNDARLSDARTPTAHTHAGSAITSGYVDQQWLGTTPATGEYLRASAVGAGQADFVAPSTVKNDLALNNVDNTSDVNKPLSTATTTALANKANVTHSHAIGDLPVAPSGTSNTTQVVRADDARLSDQRTPPDGSVSLAKLAGNSVDSTKIVDGGVAYVDLNADTKDQAAGTSSMRSLGYTAAKAMPGNAKLNDITFNNGVTNDVDFNGYHLTTVGNPTNPDDAATKGYVDLVAQGLDAKASVRAATTGSIGGGSTPGGSLTVDGFVTGNGDRILVKDQANPQYNGIYSTNTGGSWSRVVDLDTWAEVPGAFVFVEEGTVNADTGWVSTANQTGTIGTTAMPWTQFSGAGTIIAGVGMTKVGNTLDVNGTANRIVAYADAIDISSSYVGQASITTLGTITTGQWAGTAIPVANGGTGATNYNAALINLNGSLAKKGYVPALTAGVWTSLSPAVDGTDGVIIQFKEVTGGQEVVLDWRQNPGGGGEVQVKADVTYGANTLTYQSSQKAF